MQKGQFLEYLIKSGAVTQIPLHTILWLEDGKHDEIHYTRLIEMIEKYMPEYKELIMKAIAEALEAAIKTREEP